MAGRTSLSEGLESIGRKPAKPSGGSKDTTKLIIAVVLLVVAGALLAWNFGLFPSRKPAAPAVQLTPEQKAEAEKIRTREENRKDAEKAGS